MAPLVLNTMLLKKTTLSKVQCPNIMQDHGATRVKYNAAQENNAIKSTMSKYNARPQ